jgi:4-hydroxy-3-methylbut-2-enyl diphosphate reductase
VTVGASAPETPVRRVVDRISLPTGANVSQVVGVEEGIPLPLPKELALARL